MLNLTKAAAANLLGKFDINTKKVEVEPITSINDKIIKKYASQINPYIAFKKGGGNSPAYSTMRIGLKSIMVLMILKPWSLTNSPPWMVLIYY